MARGLLIGLPAGLALLALLPGSGLAQDAAPPPAAQSIPAACTAFDWPLLREMAWFDAPGLARVQSGDTVPGAMPGAVLALKPVDAIAFPVPPSRKPSPGSFGGVLTVPAPTAPGLYQITLSDEAWIDVSQDGQTTRKPTAHTGKRDCPGLRKSLRYQLGTQPVTIEISNARAESIKIAIAPAE